LHGLLALEFRLILRNRFFRAGMHVVGYSASSSFFKVLLSERNTRFVGLYLNASLGVHGGLGEDTELPGARHRLGPVGDVELAIDTGCVGFDGARGYDELLGDLAVGSAQGDEVEDF